MRWNVWVTRFIFLVCISIFISPVVGQLAVRSTLFTKNDDVVDLQGTAWTDVHRDAGHCPWIVLFYSEFCGHCRAFSPVFGDFAKALKRSPEDDPLRTVSSGAINCGVEAAACRAHNVFSVPVLFAFLPTNCTNPAGCATPPMRPVPLDLPNTKCFSRLLTETRRLLSESPRAGGAAVAGRCVAVGEALRALKAPRGPGAARAEFVETTALDPRDIAGAFFLTLYREVPLAGLAPPWREALRDFLRLVERALPGLRAGDVLRALRDFPNGPKEHDGPHGDDNSEIAARWQRAVLAARIPFYGPPHAVQWRTCLGSAPQYRGFPCGMWLLFHALAANADAADDPLHVVQSYVLKYFSCDVCRRHFAQFSFSAGSASLQLWRAHNEVNARLAAEAKSGDPRVPKRPFPPPELCGDCRNADGSFNEERVLLFLRRRYEWNPERIAGVLRGREDMGHEELYDSLPSHVFLLFIIIAVLVGAGVVRMKGPRDGMWWRGTRRMRR